MDFSHPPPPQTATIARDIGLIFIIPNVIKYNSSVFIIQIVFYFIFYNTVKHIFKLGYSYGDRTNPQRSILFLLIAINITKLSDILWHTNFKACYYYFIILNLFRKQYYGNFQILRIHNFMGHKSILIILITFIALW